MGCYGDGLQRWLWEAENNNFEPYSSCGNGSAMRVGPVGWAFDAEDEVLKMAKASAECTHNHPEGIKGAQATALLYHGTAEATVPAILKEGIIKGNRLHVHLSLTEETAINVGKRHGKPSVLRIDAKQMAEDGIKFYLSNNGVLLTEYVSPKYIIDK